MDINYILCLIIVKSCYLAAVMRYGGNVFINFCCSCIKFVPFSCCISRGSRPAQESAFDDKKGEKKRDIVTHTDRIFANIFSCPRTRLTAIYSFGLLTVCRAEGSTVMYTWNSWRFDVTFNMTRKKIFFSLKFYNGQHLYASARFYALSSATLRDTWFDLDKPDAFSP